MITVQISINGETIFARTAANTKRKTAKSARENTDTYVYKVDDGSKIEHNKEDGAIELAKKMLDTIHEQEKVE